MEFAESVETAIPSLCKLTLKALGVWKTKYIIVPPGPNDIIGPNMSICYTLYEPYSVTNKTETVCPENRKKRSKY